MIYTPNNLFQQGKSINSFKLKRKEYPLVYGKQVTKHCDEITARYILAPLSYCDLYSSKNMKNNSFNCRFCYPGCLDSRLVKGKTATVAWVRY